MAKKGQAEFALILGLIIIAALVGIYAFMNLSPPTVAPSAMTEDQKAVAGFTEDFLSEAALNSLSQVYRNGGYLESSTPALGYANHKALGNRIAYWQVCDSYSIPDVEAEFEKGVKEYIEKFLPASEVVQGTTVTYNKQAAVTGVDIYSNKVTLTINLPTVVGGQSLPQPYIVDVDTKFGRILDFSKNFARMQADCRILDNNLLFSLMQSSEHSKPCWIPTVGSASKSYTFNWNNLKDCMEMHAKYSLSNTRLGQELPVKDNKVVKWGIEFFPVPGVIDYSSVPANLGVCKNGVTADSKRYDDLNVNFYFGDDDGFDRSEFSGPERLKIQPKVGSWMKFMQGMTVAEYAQTYSVRYPVIVNVWDELASRSFKFANLVYIKESNVGSCTAIPAVQEVPQSEYSRNYDDTCVSGARENANIMVKYDDDTPVIGAEVSYVGCDLGTTADDGIITASVPSSWGSLVVKDGLNEYTECYSSSELRSIAVSIPKSSRFNFHFYTVDITRSGNTYTVTGAAAATGRVEVGLQRSGDSCAPPEPEVILNMNDPDSYVSSLDVTNIAIDDYVVGVASYDGSDLSGFADMTTFRPSGDNIYVYAPSLSGFTEDEIDNIESLYTACSISPLSSQALTIGSCTWTGA